MACIRDRDRCKVAIGLSAVIRTHKTIAGTHCDLEDHTSACASRWRPAGASCAGGGELLHGLILIAISLLVGMVGYHGWFD